jgi:hypothetical protein
MAGVLTKKPAGGTTYTEDQSALIGLPLIDPAGLIQATVNICATNAAANTTVSKVSFCQPFVAHFCMDVNEDDGTDGLLYIFNANCPYLLRVLDFKCMVADDGTVNAADTVQLLSGEGAITDAISLNQGDEEIVGITEGTSVLDEAYTDIVVGGTLKIALVMADADHQTSIHGHVLLARFIS